MRFFGRSDIKEKKIPKQWVKWVMETVKGRQICINVNETRGPIYFRTMRGLRQGTLCLHCFST
jgi:hypothetical protein